MALFRVVTRNDGTKFIQIQGRWKSAWIWFWRTGYFRLIYDHDYLKKTRKTLKSRKYGKKRREKYGSGALITSQKRKLAKRKRLMKSQRCKCVVCGGKIDLSTGTLDHIIRLSDGGGSEIENLQLIHRNCHSEKERFYDMVKDRGELSLERVLSINKIKNCHG